MATDQAHPACPEPATAKTTRSPFERVPTLVSHLLDGHLADAGQEELQRLVVADRVAARQYLLAIHLHCAMEHHFAAAEEDPSTIADRLRVTLAATTTRERSLSIGPISQWWPSRWSWVAAAALVAGL